MMNCFLFFYFLQVDIFEDVINSWRQEKVKRNIKDNTNFCGGCGGYDEGVKRLSNRSN